MPGLRASPRVRTQDIKPGMRVTHQIHGVGTVVAEWGSIVFTSYSINNSAPCPGIYDCVFGTGRHRYWHCCRAEYLTRVQ